LVILIQYFHDYIQARKDHNYAKFFHLLKSPSTPYLFSCIMFKYVEQMRKTALTIMSRTYGAKHKTTGESFYDEYPLENLVKLLCFEDEEEARAACTHYGITLEGNVIRWRNSKFAEPRDPVKGIILTLKPKKMMRTIECKLNGATRLAVCRGGVSGSGATLSSSDVNTQTSKINEPTSQQAQKDAMEEKARQMRLLEDMEKRRAEEARRKEEAAKKEAERKLKEEMKRREQQLELERQRALEEKKRLEMLRQEEERIRKEALIKEAQEREAAIKRERERQQMLEKQRKEEELKRKLLEEAERKRQLEEEAKIQAEREEHRRRIAYEYELEQQRLAEEERIRKEREEEKRWLLKVESARKILAWSLWVQQMQKRKRITKSSASLESIDPTVTCRSRLTFSPMTSIVYRRPSDDIHSRAQTIDSHLYRLATAPRETCKLAEVAADRFWKSESCTVIDDSKIPLGQPLLLFKLSVVLPQRTPQTDSIVSSLHAWADSHLQLHSVSQSTAHDRSRSRSVTVRTVATVANEDTHLCSDCDATLFLLPSSDTAPPMNFPEALIDSLPDVVPRMVLLIGDSENTVRYPKDIIDDILGPPCDGDSMTRRGVVIPSHHQLDSAFQRCCDALISASLKATIDRQPIARVSLTTLSFYCIQRMLVNLSSNGSLLRFSSPDEMFNALYDYSMTTLTSLVDELSSFYNEIKSNKYSIWPAKEFVSSRSNSVELYFDKQDDLPRDWYLPLQDTSEIEDKVYGTFQYLFSSDSFILFVAHHAPNLPDSPVRRRLLSMLDEVNIAGCLAEVVNLIVSGELNVDYEKMPTIYLPAEKMSDIIELSGYCAAPKRYKPPKLADIPSFLYNDQPSCDEVGNESIQDSSKEREVTAAEDSINEIDITPPAIHKRKPSDGILPTPSNRSNKKRSRMAGPIRVESEEVQSSKDFTSYLEILLG
jgi:chemotaxis protein histidine kinase CheA